MSKLRGNEIEYKNDEWIYSKSKESTVETWEEKPCGICGKKFTKDGRDPCIGTLPNVINACCGHGNIEEAYVQFSLDDMISGNEAIEYIKKHTKENGEK